MRGGHKLTHLLSALAVRVFLDNRSNGVPDDQDGENAGQRSLNGDEDDTDHRLGGLSDTELIDKHQDASNRQQTHNLDGDVEHIARLALEGAVPDENSQHQRLNDKLRNALGQSVLIADGHDDTLGEHVEDNGDEHPPEGLLVRVVEQLVLDPQILVLIESADIAVGRLELLGSRDDLVREEHQHARKQCQCDAGQRLGSPRIACDELIHAVEHPSTVQQHNELREQTTHRDPVVLAETSQALGQFSEERPCLEDDLDEQNDEDDSSHNARHDQEHSHEGVGIRNAQLLHISLDTVDRLSHATRAASRVGSRLGRIDAGCDVTTEKLGELGNSTPGLG